ncbi:MAG TPA: sigma-54 dependent transcriptional regulator [Kofleriaceae bacterium]|nr:sigma-54 dependent transcriptional regulator [Kofleriaceae bacterium]
MPRVLVVDRSPQTRDVVAQLLGGASEVTYTARDEATAQLRAGIAAGQPYDVVLLEAEPAPTGAQVRELITQGGGVRVVLAAPPPDGAAIAARCGAADVVARPFSAAELAFRVGRSAPPDRAEKRRTRKSDVLIGTGAWIKELYDRISMVAATDATVAIFGESGTGKELVARTIHNSSRRHEAPFVVVNCAAIPEALLEDELFGHVRGAFTDATRDRDGLLAAAHTGTLFLDEIGELPLALQAKLLRVLQSQEFRRIGDDQDRQVDVRIVTATNRDLEQLVGSGSFRQDLYYRINVFPLQLPPLRARPEDVPLLVQHFIHKYRDRLGKACDGISPAALARFQAYGFPGNVRELENKVHQAMVVAAGSIIEEEDVALPGGRVVIRGRVDLSRPFRELKQEAIDAFETQYLNELLTEHQGNLAQAARAAGMDRKNLWALVVRHGLDRAQFKKA